MILYDNPISNAFGRILHNKPPKKILPPLESSAEIYDEELDVLGKYTNDELGIAKPDLYTKLVKWLEVSRYKIRKFGLRNFICGTRPEVKTRSSLGHYQRNSLRLKSL
jgi:hypothetical protein